MDKILNLNIKLLNKLDPDSEAYKLAFEMLDILAKLDNPTHICPYCGEYNNTPLREDELCDNCKMTFGHSFYSEL